MEIYGPIDINRHFLSRSHREPKQNDGHGG
jgi:hypothetical protein